uniref:Uncharacterized protein n=1 Tax=Oryza glumipatula TaxID=40148 RepID=A0A0E0A6H6_9ORYZ
MCVPIASAQVSWALSSSTFQPGPFISSNCPSRLVFLVVLQVCFHLSSISEFLPPAARRRSEVRGAPPLAGAGNVVFPPAVYPNRESSPNPGGLRVSSRNLARTVRPGLLPPIGSARKIHRSQFLPPVRI